MIQTATVSGRPAEVAYIGAGQKPVAPDEAVLIKVLFTDEAGGTVFLVGPQGQTNKLFDESQHPRDEHGRWTDAGGSDDHPGQGYSKDAYLKDGVIHTDNVYDAARALHENRRVELTQPRGVSVLLDRLGEVSRDMIAKGEKAPTFDLCKVTIKGTSLFCADSKGIPRVQMPQLTKEQDQPFFEYLKAKGYKIEQQEQFASHLRATQNELNGAKVAGIAKAMQTTEGYHSSSNPIFVSKDDYILDGHHRWAAEVGVDAIDNVLGNDKKMAIWRVDIPITKLLEEAESFTGGAGKLSVEDEAARKRAWGQALGQALALLEARKKKPKRPAKTEIELWPESGESRDDFMDRCVIALTKCIGAERAPRVCARKWRKAERLGKKGMVTRAAIEALDDAALLIEPCGEKCIACEGRDAPFVKAWNEADHPRVPAGSGDPSGQFAPGGGGTGSAPSSKPKGKKKVSKADFDKAKITIAGEKAQQDAFIERWNDKIGEDPAEFKKGFMGGLDGHMNIGGSGSQMEIKGQIEDAGGKVLGSFTRNIDLDNKIAKSAYFELQGWARNSDVGKHLLAGNVETYQELGIEKVRVYANINVGGYAWAKYGYVPEASAWATLRASLERKIEGGGSRAPRGDNTIEADDWNSLSSDRQDDVRDAWMRSTYSEFLSSEEQNWRESGEAKTQAKSELASMYGGGDIPEWATEAFDGARAYREEREQPPIPYSNKQLYDAIELKFEPSNYDGEEDPEITFDDDKLKEPLTYDPAQGTLPGIEPIDPASFLTKDMRDRIKKRMIESFDRKAEEDAPELDPPSYLSESVGEYQEEYWDQKDDDEKLRHAVDLGLADIEIESEDEDEEPELELPEAEEDELLTAVQSSDPKSIWKVADHPRGKELLLGTNWNGVLNLKDKESMERFNAYVGRREKRA